MSALAVYFGSSTTSFLLESNDKLEFSTLPYVYSKELFGSVSSSQKFHTSLIDAFLLSKGKKTTDVDILVTGCYEAPSLSIKPAFETDLGTVLNSIQDYWPLAVDNYSIISKKYNFCYAQNSVEKKNNLAAQDRNVEEANYYANLSILPQIITSDIATQVDLDRNIALKAIENDLDLKPAQNILFTGCRFAQDICSKELTYLLMLDLVRNPGIYPIFLDTRNATILLTLLQLFQPDTQKHDLSKHITYEGILVKAPGPVECTVDAGLGTVQLFEVLDDSVFVLPLIFHGMNKVHLKNPTLGTVEKSYLGGRTGIIFDTRKSTVLLSDNMKSLNKGIKEFSRVINSL